MAQRSTGPTDVAIAGGHGRIARYLTRRLTAGGDRVRSLIGDPSHAGDVEADGAEPFVCDSETASSEELARGIFGARAVVFAAAAGPGSSPERTRMVDADAAVRLLEAAKTAHVRRYLMISTRGAENPPDGDDAWSVYLRAKARADSILADSDLAWTIVRPGPMSDAADLGRVAVDTIPVDGDVTREDLAATLAHVLHEPRSARLTLYVAAGEYPVAWALESVVRPPGPSLP